MKFSSSSPLFDHVTGDLLPEHRDAYLLNRLPPESASQVESYLRKSPVQTGILLGRYHQLAEVARTQGRTFAPPAWVQRQLIFQPTSSKAGPLRRPVVQVALAFFLLLSVASVVQWIRNEPLVPAPVVAAVTRAATSARQATRQLVQQLQPAAPSRPAVAAVASAPAAPAPKPARRSTTAPAGLPVREAALAPVSSRDSLVSVLPTVLPATSSSQPAAAASAGLVRGRITDEQGRPLAGATVLVLGSRTATSTNATGDYALEVPAGAVLQFGYGGYADELMRAAGPGALNVTLLPKDGTSTRKNRLPNRALSLQ